jgi:hypothetical protein
MQWPRVPRILGHSPRQRTLRLRSCRGVVAVDRVRPLVIGSIPHLEPRLPREHRGRNGKLTEAQLDRILELVKAGRSLREIADDLEVNYLVISGLKLGGLFRRV